MQQSTEQNGTSNGSVMYTRNHDFLTDLVGDIFRKVFEKSDDRQKKVVDFKQPEELEELLDLSLNKPTSDERLLEICNDVIKYSVQTGHPRFFNQLYGGIDQYTLGGSWLTESLNTSMFTYEVAPVFTVMEKYVIEKMLGLVGMSGGDGTFCPGGSMSNMYGLNLARCSRFPQAKMDGLSSLPRMCILASEQAHFSIRKGAAFLGFGVKSVTFVKCDDSGHMMTSELERHIQELKSQGQEPVCVVATSGTTVLGAFDPLAEIADVCEKYKIWMHVDSAWGGAVLLSRKHSKLMAGIERADSVTWNPHKMMGALNQCSVFLTKHKDLLVESHSAQANYLYQPDKCYDVTYDAGDKSVQCGRKVDVLKLWLMWKAKGDNRLSQDVDNALECASHLRNRLENSEGFRMVVREPEFTNVCFWYIPPSMRNRPEDGEWTRRLSQVAPAIKKGMMLEGTMMIGFQPLGDKVNFFRMILSNVDVTVQDMDFVVSAIHRLGRHL